MRKILPLVLALSIFSTGVAHADPPATRRWYGWQTATADLAAILVGIGGVASGDAGIGIVGLAVFVVASPVIHVAHGRSTTGAGSFLLRLLAPALTGAVGMTVACSDNGCRGDFGGNGQAVGFAMGGSVGVLTAAIVDAAALGYEDVPVVYPTIAVTPDQTMFGLAGNF